MYKLVVFTSTGQHKEEGRTISSKGGIFARKIIRN